MTSEANPNDLRDETLSATIDGHAHDDDRALMAAHDGDENWMVRRDELHGVHNALTMLAASDDLEPEVDDQFYSELVQAHAKVVSPKKISGIYQLVGIAAALLLVVGAGASVIRTNNDKKVQNIATASRTPDNTNTFNNNESARQASGLANEAIADNAAPSALAGSATSNAASAKATALVEQPPITAGAQDYPALAKILEPGFTSDDDFRNALKEIRAAGYLNSFKPGFTNPAVNTCRTSTSSLDWSGRTTVGATEVEIYVNAFQGTEGSIAQIGTLLIYNYTYPKCNFRYAFP